MTFVSYAQNFEDVMLWRALQHVRAGFYIDAGANHPDIDSVTRAFYDRGWSGINVEPVADDARRLRASRTRDLTLAVALGEAPGDAVFHVVEGTGLSTMDGDAVAEFARQGFAVSRARVPVRTLAEICAEHVAGEIHFLKIDVEGAERAVLAGADFARWRPWIVLLEATAPLSTTPTHAEWEPILLAAGYRFAWFDGLNRWYIADERWDALSPHFQVAPNVFDDFVRAGDTEWARRIARAETLAGEWRERAQAAEARLRDETRASLQAMLVADRWRMERLKQAVEAELREQRVLAAEREAAEARDWMRAMRGSTSWKVTRPLRAGVRALQRARGRTSPELLPQLPALPAPVEQQPAAPSVAERPIALPPPPAFVRGLTRTVHQFHSGSAVGDAVTNAMLLIRRELRARGYDSEIFVEHRDPALAGELRTLDELPEHDGYVLVAHHSQGFDAFERVAALPAAKVLMYHNITPPEYLADAPVAADYARLGRRQLAGWRDRVAAALAFSEHSALELRRLGFAPVQTAALLFDLDALRARVQPVTRGGDPFTILFVGRVAAAKGQDALLAAYDRFRAAFGAPSRLVLVGRAAVRSDTYLSQPDGFTDTIHAEIERRGLASDVILTGLVSDEALAEWYAAADLYVSLSHHEGFGVPLVEAMAAGVPVLAAPAGAVAEILDDDAAMLPSREPVAVAAAMLSLARDPGARAALAARQAASLARFALAPQMDRLLLALARAGAAPPADPSLRARLDRDLRFAVSGHVNGSYSLALINRSLAAAIEAERPGTVRLLPVEGEPTADLSRVPDAEHAAIAALVARPVPPGGPEFVISQHYPVHVPPVPGDAAAALFFWEESLIPLETISTLAAGFRAVFSPSRFVTKALIDSGLPLPVATVGFAPDLAAWRDLAARRRPGVDRAFTFLHVSSCFPRKGVDLLLAAYAARFRAGDAVRLVIKGFPNPHNDVAGQIAALRARNPDAPAIELIDREIGLPELLDLYRDADVLVLPTRGEGFNIPAAEAMAAGLPLIVTGFGGHMDFCDADTARLVAYRFARSASHLASGQSVWAEPDLDDLAAALRESFDDRPAALARAARASEAVGTRLARAPFVERLAEAALDTLLDEPASPPRIAWVSTWDVRCGIAEYSRFLLGQWPSEPGSGPVTVLCDDRVVLDPLGAGPSLPGVSHRAAWRVGDRDSLPTLIAALRRAGPDIVAIQHQPGLLPWDMLASLVTDPVLAGRVVTVTLHNSRQILDLAAKDMRALAAALGTVSRVVVHTLADLNLLQTLGLEANVVMIPQGAPQPPAPRAPRPLGPEDAPLIGCYGFLLPGKGVPQLIEAFGLLKSAWPKARLRLVNAEYDLPQSGQELLACREAAEAAGLARDIEWQTEFLPTQRSLELLAECDVVALPYQASKEASSAALRTALCAGTPIAVTPLSLFDEADDAVERFEGTDAASIAQGIGRLLSEFDRRVRVQRAAMAWLDAHDWRRIASRTQGMLLGLARQRRAERGNAP